jgi:hypothetical protein
MLIYPTLAAYLTNRFLRFDSEKPLTLRGKDRPFLVLEADEKLLKPYNFLIERAANIYEVGFPWVQVTDWQSQHKLTQTFDLEIESLGTISLSLADEVLDETQISNDEELAQRLQQELEQQCDRVTAETIALWVGLFHFLRFDTAGEKTAAPVLAIAEGLHHFSQAEARLPLVVALNRRYELRHKLELIAPKLRSQLNRNTELIPLGLIQEMDAYCLRDYIRRPGHNAIEKAGAKQELIGVKRYQNFNTPENRFLKGFCDLLHLDCHDYRDRYPEAKALEQAINRFRQEPSVQTIPRTHTFTVKPNYVLQQNPIYRSFYQAYLDYLKRRTEKETLWGVRQRLLVDGVAMLLTAALLKLEGSYVTPLTAVEVLDTPDRGRYLANLTQKPIVLFCFLKNAVFEFKITQPIHPKAEDLQLKVIQHCLTSEAPPRSQEIPIWIFWYKPSPEILDRLATSQLTFCLYLDDLDESESSDYLNLLTLKIPHPIEEDLDTGATLLCEQICTILSQGET